MIKSFNQLQSQRCTHIGCDKKAIWHFDGQWQSCNDHVDEAERELREHVNSTITRSKINYATCDHMQQNDLIDKIYKILYTYEGYLSDGYGYYGGEKNVLMISQEIAGLLCSESELKECIWSEDEDGNWITTCGNTWVFFDGTPLDNNISFCPFCGKHLQQSEFLRGENNEKI